MRHSPGAGGEVQEEVLGSIDVIAEAVRTELAVGLVGAPAAGGSLSATTSVRRPKADLKIIFVFARCAGPSVDARPTLAGVLRSLERSRNRL